MKRLTCFLIAAILTITGGLQTQSLRGAGNHSARLHLQGAQPDEMQDVLSGFYVEKEKEAKIEMTENDKDLLTDGYDNPLYNKPNILADYTMSIKPNPSWEGKETLMTREKIEEFAQEAQEDIAKDKDYVHNANSTLFDEWTMQQRLVASPSQMRNNTPMIVGKNSSYWILDTRYKPWAGVDIPGIKEAEKLAAEKAIRDKIKKERWKAAKKRLREKRQKDKALVERLESMSVKALRDEALQIGALEEELDECDEAKNPQKELMRIVLRYKALQEANAEEQQEVEAEAVKADKREADLKKGFAAEGEIVPREDASLEEMER